MGIITLVISDTHIGGFTGLALPTMELEDGGQIQSSPAQKWLLACYEDLISHAVSLVGRNDRLMVIHCGDMIDGYHHSTLQALPNVRDQVQHAIQLFSPLASLAEAGFYICRGTESHVQNDELTIAQELGARIDYDWIFDINGGIIIDCAHHGSTPRRRASSSAAATAQEARQLAQDEERRPPRIVLRGHSHMIDDSGERVPGTRAIHMPSFQLKTAYGHQVSRNGRSDIGGLIILPDGTLDTSRLRYYAEHNTRKVTRI